MLLKEIKVIFHQELDKNYPKEEVDSFFYMFMEHYLGLDRFALALQPNYVLSKKEEKPFFEGLTRLRNDEPIQYILGVAHFMDLKLKVNPSVLIPRPETEELVQWVLDTVRSRSGSGLVEPVNLPRILDIGTGSGCIAIAIAKSLPNAGIYALDISTEALEVAQQNAELNQVELEFFQADVLNADLDKRFDILVSNPPYVRELEKTEMQKNVLNHEPELALFVPDNNALKYYKAIIEFSFKHLRSGGNLFLEINQYLADETRQLLLDNDFIEVQLRKDIFGNFRLLKGKKN